MIQFRQDHARRLEAFFRAFKPRLAPLLLLDYDGTLAPFRKDRFQARPYAGIAELLAGIQQGPTRVVFVTGRPAGEIAPLLGLDKLEVWGLHGAEHLWPDGRRELAELPNRTLWKLEQLRAQLKRDSFGALFEDKPNAAVLHWRGASGESAEEIRENALALFRPFADPEGKPGGLTLLEFASGLELRAGPDKGSAVAAILREADPASPAAFLGDDLTDEPAFRVVNAQGGPGISVLVRREARETAAEVWIRPPAELRTFLKRWRAACQW